MKDLAIYIALQEELDAFLAVWPEPDRVQEESAVSVVTYHFAIPAHGSDATYSVVVACSGAMGTERAATLASYLVTTYQPRYVASIGIAGAVSKDLRIGDVVAPKTVRNYLANSAAVDNGAGWEYQSSANTFQTDQRFLDRLNNFSSVYGPLWMQKFTNTSDTIDERVPGLLRAKAEESIINLPPKVHANEIVLASGPTVAKSAHFLDWIRKNDRKVTAIDMEAAGVLEASRVAESTKFIALRAISDFADSAKAKLEDETQGEFRILAMENCASLMLSYIESGLLAEEKVVCGRAAMTKPLEFSDKFREQLEATEIVFQHPHKDLVQLSDLFVYPDLAPIVETQPPTKMEVENSGLLLNVDQLPVTVAIFGHSQSGKTSLARSLAGQYHGQGLIPILLNGGMMRNLDVDAALRAQIRAQFSGTFPDPVKEKDRVIILVDDFDKIKLNKKGQLEIVRQLQDRCRSLLTFTSAEAKLSQSNLIRFDGAQQYSILKFGHMRRSDLIKKWISAGRVDQISNAEMLAREDELTTHINSVLLGNVLPSRPFYLLVALQTIESTHSLPGQQLSSYGHCYQALILQAFSRIGVAIEDFDAYMNYLSALAYFLFSRKLELGDQSLILEFERTYREAYLFSAQDQTLRKSLECGILSQVGDSVGFRHRFMQYFFCARYLADNYDRAEIKAVVEKITNNIYLERNAKIAVFLTHHTKNQSILDGITLTAMGCFEELKEATLDREETSHYQEYDAISPAIVLEEREASEERKKHLAIRDKRDLDRGERDDATENEADEAEPDRLLADMNGSFRAVELIGQVLRNRYGSFRRDQLVTMAEEAVNAGLRALRQYQDIYSNHRDEIVSIIRELLAEDDRSSDEEIASRAKKIYFAQCYWVSFLFLEKISEMLGYKRLIEVFEEIASKKQRSVAMDLIILSMKLNAEKIVPRKLIGDLISRTRSDPVAQRLLRQMVVRYLYLNEASLQDKNWIVSELGLPLMKQKQLLVAKIKDRPRR